MESLQFQRTSSSRGVLNLSCSVHVYPTLGHIVQPTNVKDLIVLERNTLSQSRNQLRRWRSRSSSVHLVRLGKIRRCGGARMEFFSSNRDSSPTLVVPE